MSAKYCIVFYIGEDDYQDQDEGQDDPSAHACYLWVSCKLNEVPKIVGHWYFGNKLPRFYSDSDRYAMMEIIEEGQYLVFRRNDEEEQQITVVDSISDEFKEHLTRVCEYDEEDEDGKFIMGRCGYSMIYNWKGEIVFEPTPREMYSCDSYSHEREHYEFLSQSDDWLNLNYSWKGPEYISMKYEESDSLAECSPLPISEESDDTVRYLFIRRNLSNSIEDKITNFSRKFVEYRFGFCTVFNVSIERNINYTWREPNGLALISIYRVDDYFVIAIKKLKPDRYKRIIEINNYSTQVVHPSQQICTFKLSRWIELGSLTIYYGS